MSNEMNQANALPSKRKVKCGCSAGGAPKKVKVIQKTVITAPPEKKGKLISLYKRLLKKLKNK